MRNWWTRYNRRQRWAAVAVVCLLVGVVGSRWILVEYQVWRGQAALRRSDLQTAQAAFQAAADQASHRGDIQFWLARTYRKRGDAAEATRCLKRAGGLGIDPQRLQREETLMRVQAGQLTMESRAVSALLADPQDDGLEIYTAIVLGSMVSYQTDMALVVLESWIGDYPQDPQPHYMRGLIHENDTNWIQAEVSFRKLLEYAPNRTDAHLHLAHVLREQHRYSEAVIHYRHCLSLAPNSDALAGLGRCHQARREPERARRVFGQLLDRDANHYDGLLAMGQLELSAGRWASAVDRLGRAVAARPYEFDARIGFAMALLCAGDLDQSRAHFEKSAAIQDASRRVRGLMGQVRADPENAQLRLQIGRTLLEQGQAADALLWFQGALRIDPRHRPTHRQLADYYESQGDADLAAQHREMSRSADQMF